MKIIYEIYDLGGNPTAIITKNVDTQTGINVSKQIMQKYPVVEQVAIIENVKDDTCTFRMAGEEFCGNAIRAVAYFMRKNYGKPCCTIITCGIKINATKCDGKTSEIVLQKSTLLRGTRIVNGLTYIIMNGITHVVIPGKGNESLAKQVKKIASKFGLVGSAFGVMFLDGDKLNPFVWVETAQTFFNETACLSGSIAVAIYIKKDKAEIIQPTNQPYTITFDGDNIYAKGKVAFIKSDEI
ncbi:MAG: hypothetical protein FWE16_02095 [Firmicutes bacterium]|nr:hypothetical protein [Bacillota bacterium]